MIYTDLNNLERYLGMRKHLDTAIHYIKEHSLNDLKKGCNEVDGDFAFINCFEYETLPEETELYDLAELFKVFGDSTRIRILFVLFEAEVCVCDLAKVLNMTQSAISHQLRILKQNKLVKNRREGKSIFYSLADDHVRTIINQGRDHIEED